MLVRIAFVAFFALLAKIWIPQGNVSQTQTTSPLTAATQLKSHYNKDFFYYYHGVELTHLGDTNGQRTAMNQYPPKEMARWLGTLNALNPQPDLLPFLVTYLFCATSNQDLLRLYLNFLTQHAHQNLSRKWRWAARAIFIADQDLKDADLAMQYATELSQKARQLGLPFWAQTADLHLLKKRNQGTQALELINEILKNHPESLSIEEKNLLLYQRKTFRQLR